MSSPRSYGDPCGIARALDAVGERWALLIVRELQYGPRRFTDLREGLTGASPNVLSQRLRELEDAGVVRKVSDGGRRYALTDWGRDLGPILVQLGQWGARSAERPTGELSVAALLVALESTFQPDAATDLEATVELRLDGATYAMVVDHGRLEIVRGPARHPGATVETDAGTLRAVVFGDVAFGRAGLDVDGDQRLARRVLGLFRRPVVAAHPTR